jgi:1-acyl-sn-glycerol-3-phosphate acyltransferase
MSIAFRARVLFFYFTVTIASIVFFSIFWIPLKYSKKYRIKYALAVAFSYIFVSSAKFLCGLNYHVKGLDKLPTTPSLVLSNHQSFWDNVFMQVIIPRHSWIIKKQLYTIPIFGWGLKMLNPIAVDRSYNSSVKQILLEGERKFKENLWLVMFPESTRLTPEQTVKFKTSAAKLALMNKVPVVLMAHNAGVYWPKGFWFHKSGTVQVTIAKVLMPDEIEDLGVKELTSLIEETINTEKNRLYESSKKA